MRAFAAAAIGSGLFALPAQSPAKSPPKTAERKVEAEWVELDKVVDGDTLRVHRNGKSEPLRLMSVDTEERLGPGHSGSATKPQTVFGEETALWAERLFADLGKDGAPPRVGLVFPGGAEARDVYGRLLCHVLLPDGTDYNLMLVKLGRSPYFNKYGNDPIDDAGFAAAQRAARKAQIGVWDPSTNQPTTKGAPSAKRHYPELIAWWNARSIAVEGWRKRSAVQADAVDAEDASALERALRSG